MKKSFILLFSLFLTISCGSDREIALDSQITISSLKQLQRIEKTPIQGKAVSMKQSLLLGTNNLVSTTDYLVLCRFVGVPSYFELFDLKTLQHIKTFGFEGEGPGEFVGYAFTKALNHNLIGINARQMGGDYFEANLDSLSGESDYILDRKFSFAYDADNQFTQLESGQVISLGLNLSKRLAFLDKEGKVKDSFFSYPFEKELGFEQDVFGMAYQADIVKSDSLGRVAVFNKASPNWDVYQVSGTVEPSLVSTIHLAPPSCADLSTREDNMINYSVGFNPDNVRCFTHLKSTERYIYALFSGKKYSDPEALSDMTNDLFVFDWEGEVVKRYELDRNVMAITVLNDDKTMIALHESYQESELVRYTLNH